MTSYQSLASSDLIETALLIKDIGNTAVFSSLFNTPVVIDQKIIVRKLERILNAVKSDFFTWTEEELCKAADKEMEAEFYINSYVGIIK